MNLEDGLYEGDFPLRPAEEQADRLIEARKVADAARISLFINARIDTYLRTVGDPAERLEDTLARAAAYVAAGADGIFVPGATDAAVVRQLTAGIAAPVNVMVGPGAPTVDELSALGVARVSLGASIASAAYGLVQRAVREALETGGYSTLHAPISYGEINALLVRR